MKGIDTYALRQKRILITGATGHLGSAMVGALAEAGAHVLINARTEVRCHELATQICSQGYSAEAAVFDVRSPKAVSEFFASQTGLPLHGLVNNAFAGAGAGGVSGGGIEESNDESFVFGFDIALVAAGGYGMLIADFIFTELKKSVMYIGGALQLFFGIIGKRWFDNNEILEMMNDNWIRPDNEDKPANFVKVEKGCYW